MGITVAEPFLSLSLSFSCFEGDTLPLSFNEHFDINLQETPVIRGRCEAMRGHTRTQQLLGHLGLQRIMNRVRMLAGVFLWHVLSI